MTIFNQRFIPACILIGLLTQSVFATTYYVSQNGNPPNTNSLVWLNSTYLYTGGDVIHLTGIFTNSITATGSGAQGNPVTLLFDQNAGMIGPTINGVWINLSGQNNITVDGGVNGIIEDTNNGTVIANGGTCATGNNDSGIWAGACTNITIQNLSIINMYNRQTNTEPIQGTGDGNGIGWTGNNLIVSNCVLSGAMNGIMAEYNSVLTSNLTVTACIISNFNHGITLGAGAVTSPLFDNVYITHNTLQGGDMYETYNNLNFGLHRDPIFFFNESSNQGGCISNILIAYNFINMGIRPLSNTAGSGAMFFDFYNSGMATHVRVYNNVSTLAYPLSWSGGGGFIAGGGNDVLVANNTAVAWESNGVCGTGQISIYGTNDYMYNNILVSQNGFSVATSINTNGVTFPPPNPEFYGWYSNTYSDYNILNQQASSSAYVECVFENGGAVAVAKGWNGEWIIDSFADWTNAIPGHLDMHSQTATVQLAANFQPLNTDTVANGNGTNLTAWGITDDYAGNPRPAIGNWMIGAYQVATRGVIAVSSPIISVTLTSGVFGTIAVGTTTNESFVVQNTGGGTLTGNASVYAPFSIVSGGAYSLAAGQSANIVFSYNPTITGTNSQIATFSGGGGTNVMLNGAATMPPPQNLVPHAPGA